MNPLHGSSYQFWSGIGNDLPIYLLGIVPLIVAWYRHHKCHWPKCYRLGHYPFHHYKLCRKHHPNVPKCIPVHIAKLHKQNKKVV